MNLRILLAIAAAAMLVISPTARADSEADLKAKIDALQKQLDAVKAQLNADHDRRAGAGRRRRKRRKRRMSSSFSARRAALTFLTPGGGDVTLYGNLDVSFDYATKGLQGSYAQGGSPVGKMGWKPDISTNLSYLGVRGHHPIAGCQFRLAIGGGDRHFRDAWDEEHELQHQRHRQRRAVFAQQFYRLHRQGMGRGHDRKVGNAIQDLDRPPQSILGNG